MGRAGMPCAQEKGNKATLEKNIWEGLECPVPRKKGIKLHWKKNIWEGLECPVPRKKGNKATFPSHSSLQWRIIGGGGDKELPTSCFSFSIWFLTCCTAASLNSWVCCLACSIMAFSCWACSNMLLASCSRKQEIPCQIKTNHWAVRKSLSIAMRCISHY